MQDAFFTLLPIAGLLGGLGRLGGLDRARELAFAVKDPGLHHLRVFSPQER